MTCLRDPGELQMGRIKSSPLLAIKEEIRVNLKTVIFEGDSLVVISSINNLFQANWDFISVIIDFNDSL